MYDDAQRLTAVRAGSDTGSEIATFFYDASGNLINSTESGVQRTLAYDAFERLVGVTIPSSLLEEYRYDDSGRRIEKISNGVTNQNVYSGRNVWTQYSDDWSQALAHLSYTGLDAPLLRATADPANTR